MIATSPKPETLETASAGQPIFIAHNEHIGEPPQVVSNTDPDKYVAYFVDRANDQWLLQINLETGHAVLQGGDLEWREVAIERDEFPAHVILDEASRQWLQACWAAVGRS